MSKELSSDERILPLTRAEYEGNKPVRMVRAAVRIAVIAEVAEVNACLFVRHPTKGLELPGGAIDPGESPLLAMLRELREETGIHLTDDHAFTLVDILPVKDSRGGYWVDIIYGTVLDPFYLEIILSHLQSVEAEFPVIWLTLEEVVRQVDQYCSSYSSAKKCLMDLELHK